MDVKGQYSEDEDMLRIAFLETRTAVMSVIHRTFKKFHLHQAEVEVLVRAARRLRNLQKIGAEFLERLRLDVYVMGDEAFLDAWARCQDSAFYSVFYGFWQGTYGLPGPQSAIDIVASDRSRSGIHPATCY